jgi:hypothetical protein
MNRKGQVIIYGLMVSLCIIILALALAKPTTDFSSTAMGNTTADHLGLNCTDGSIDNYYRGACIVTDLYAPYLIGIMLFLAGGIIISKIIFD